MDVNLDLERIWILKIYYYFINKNVFYEKIKIVYQNNFSQHQIDQNNKIILKILTIPKLKVIYRNLIKRIHSLKYLKKINYLRDSMMKALAERGISNGCNVKVRPQPGYTT